MTVVRVGGLSLIAGALGFVAVFTYLAMQFDYPAILDGSAAEVLPRLLATGTTGRAVWAVYGFLPLIFIPAGVGALYALREDREGSMVVALLVSPVAAVNNYLLPLWMIIFGVALLRDDSRTADAESFSHPAPTS